MSDEAGTILFGCDATPGVVAVEPGSESVTLVRRVGGQVSTETRPFRRWILTSEKHSLADAHWIELDGDGFRFLAEFPDRESYQAARFWLRDAHADHIALPSASKQFLMRSGITLFKEMGFDDALRMQLDIETLGLSPTKPANEIFLVSVTDNTGFEQLISGDEKSILKQVIECIRERDPDVIEGHNILGFDLPYIAERAQLLGVKLPLGRDGSEMTCGGSRSCAVGYYSRPYLPWHIWGRQILDTLLGVQRYDVSRGALPSYGLKACAEALGVAEPERCQIPHDRIAQEWRENPDRVRTYCLQDAKETRALAGIVLPPDFYTTQMVPEAYSLAATTGNGEKINSILIREYLRQGKAIPMQSNPKPLPGGYTEVQVTGVVERIVKCDVESLYPSIMLTRGIKPASDTLGIFLPALSELTRRRIEAKRRAKETEGREHAYWDGLQAAFKILINSFYGYLGAPFNFNDFDAAAQVTSIGRETVKQIVAELQHSRSKVVEVDTDGVYFQPPDDVADEEAEIAYIEEIGATLPEGIRLAHDGRYRAMISLKMKNYILEPYKGHLIFKGSALRSRADEKFGMQFIHKAARLLLEHRTKEIGELYLEMSREINERRLDVEQFSRRERITNKTFESVSRRRIAVAAREAKVGDYVRVYQKSDGSIGLVDDYDNDEDTDYLLDKLYKFALRLKDAIGPEFDVLIPKRSAMSRSEAAGQQRLGLFD